MRKILDKISIVIVCYNSSFKLKEFIQKIPNETKILIIDNSKDYLLKKLFGSKKSQANRKETNITIINTGRIRLTLLS